MTLSTLLSSQVHEKEVYQTIPINDFGDENGQLKKIDNEAESAPDIMDSNYIQWQIFDEIPEQVYTIQFDG